MKFTRRTTALTMIMALLMIFASHTGPAASQSHMDKLLFLELANARDSESWGLLLVNLKGVLAGLEEHAKTGEVVGGKKAAAA